MPQAVPNSGIKDSHLLGNAIESIAVTFPKRLANGLQDSRQFVLPTLDRQLRADSAFELVTWLVIPAP